MVNSSARVVSVRTGCVRFLKVHLLAKRPRVLRSLDFDPWHRFLGVGWANQIIASMCNIYYCIIVAWAFFYVLSSFSGILPWENCGHWWNQEKNGTTICYNKTAINDTSYLGQLAAMGLDLNDTETPVEQFWESVISRIVCADSTMIEGLFAGDASSRRVNGSRIPAISNGSCV